MLFHMSLRCGLFPALTTTASWKTWSWMPEFLKMIPIAFSFNVIIPSMPRPSWIYLHCRFNKSIESTPNFSHSGYIPCPPNLLNLIPLSTLGERNWLWIFLESAFSLLLDLNIRPRISLRNVFMLCSIFTIQNVYDDVILILLILFIYLLSLIFFLGSFIRRF